MGGALVRGLSTTDALAAVFSDEALIGAMTEFEVALARAEAASGLVPERVAPAITEAARVHSFDVAKLVEGQRRSGTAVIPFVEALTDAVRQTDPRQRAVRALGRDQSGRRGYRTAPVPEAGATRSRCRSCRARRGASWVGRCARGNADARADALAAGASHSFWIENRRMGGRARAKLVAAVGRV